MAAIHRAGFNPGIQATETAFATEQKGATRASEQATEQQVADGSTQDADMAAVQAADNSQGNVADADQEAELSDNKKMTSRNNTDTDSAELSFGEGGAEGAGEADELQHQKRQQQELQQMRKGGGPSASSGASEGRRNEETQTHSEVRHREIAHDEEVAAHQADEEETVEKDGLLEAKAEHARTKAAHHQQLETSTHQAMETMEEGAMVAGRKAAGRNRAATSPDQLQDHSHDPEEASEQAKADAADSARSVQRTHDEAVQEHMTEERRTIGGRNRAQQEDALEEAHAKHEEEDAGRVGVLGGAQGQGGAAGKAGELGIDGVDTVQAGPDVQGIFDKAGVGQPRTTEQHLKFALGDTPREVVKAATNMVEPQIRADGTVNKGQAQYKAPDPSDPTRVLHLTRVGAADDVMHSDGISGKPMLELAGRTEGQPLEASTELEVA